MPKTQAQQVAPQTADTSPKNPMAGAIFDRLSAAGACLIPLASSGLLHANVTSKLPSKLPVAEVGAKARELAKAADWGGFNFGYLIGERASYSACASSTGQKKAKKNSAFVWAAFDEKTKTVSLLTASGNSWVRPSQAGRLQEDYDRAMAAARRAFGVEK